MILLLPLGAILGFFLGGILAIAVAILLAIPLGIFGALASFIAGTVLPVLLAPLAIGLSTGTALLIGLLSLFIATAIGYALAAVGTLGPIAATPLSPTATSPLPPAPLELFMRGFLIGMAASINFAGWSIILGNPIVGAVAALITLGAAIPGLSAVLAYQILLGWTSIFMPMGYLFLIIPFGLILFLLAVFPAIASGGPGALRFDVRTFTFEVTGGAFIGFMLSITPAPFAGFNMGPFVFLSLPAVVPPPPVTTVQTPFAVPGLSSHETGHTLNLAAFGSAYHWMNALDQNIPPLARRSLAYGELTAESHAKRNFARHVTMW
ncbi:MAG: hypothetical protein WD825_10640 [Gemmatimonadaceae bacterium]